MRITALALAVFVAIAANGQTKYNNPVLNSDYSDPDVECVDGEFWMTSSSFNCVPGLQILHSYDLVNWKIVGAALPKESPYWDGAIANPDHGDAVWAPCIRYRKSNGRFYIFWGDPDRGIFQVNAEDPAGEWSNPVCVIEGKGLIDSSPLFDEDGKVYLVHGWAGSRAGFKSVLSVCELNSDCTAAKGEQVLVFDGNKNGNITVEGPKFYKRDGWYWIFAPAGGVKTGWQLAMRSKSVFGPYEYKRVCEAAEPKDVAKGRAADTRAPHQGGWVNDAEGKSWFLHFEDRGAWGRVVHLQPMEWTKDGWCIIGKDVDRDGIGEPVSSWKMPATKAHKEAYPESPSGIATEAAFTGVSIPLNWQWHARPTVHWAMTDPSDGCLRLNCIAHEDGWNNLWDTPNLLLEKIVGPETVLSSKLVFKPSYNGDRVGMVVMGKDYATIEMCYDGKSVSLQRRECKKASAGGKETIIEQIPLESEAVGPEKKQYCTVYLKVTVTLDGDGGVWLPYARCNFFYSTDGADYKPLGTTFDADAGLWIGAKLGYFATADIKKNDGGSVEIY